MFGIGGTTIELLKDVSFRIAPITRRDASEMIREIKGFPLLDGYREAQPVDFRALEDILLKVSDFAAGIRRIEEMDLNPVFARSDGAIEWMRASFREALPRFPEICSVIPHFWR